MKLKYEKNRNKIIIVKNKRKLLTEISNSTPLQRVLNNNTPKQLHVCCMQ